jgi:wyosine [tRNA(Phe)-imidazoG37] synthetase (radical SAM superfamily)
LENQLAQGEVPDYISLAGSGEPTLNSGIGDLIRKIKLITSIPVAVLTNGSLLLRDDVQEELLAADLVLPSLDAGDAALFHLVNRPDDEISFERMIKGLVTFTQRFSGEVWLEVFLLGGITGIASEAEKINAIIERIQPHRIQLNTVARPPAEDFAFALSMKKMRALQKVFTGQVEIISESSERTPSVSRKTSVAEEQILALLGRRPCTCFDLAKGLGIHVMAVMKILDPLVASGKVNSVAIGGKSFYGAKQVPVKDEAPLA